jgi:hypothetical protein
MAIRRLSLASISTGVKSSKFYDGVTQLPGAKGYSYIVGGYDGGSSRTDIQKFDLLSTTRTTISATLSDGSTYGAGVSNSNVAGYSISPSVASNGVTYCAKVTYSTDARTNTTSGAVTAHGGARTGMSNSGTAGYSAGGYAGGNLSQISKILFSSDTGSTISASLASARREVTQGGDKNNAGYILGGYTDGGWSNTIQKLTFSNESRSSLGATLPSAGGQVPTSVDTGTALYMMGDQDVSGSGNRIFKITFSGETTSTLSATLTTKRNVHGAGQAKGYAGYVMGGIATGGTYIDSIEKFDFATATVSAVASTLAFVVNTPASFSNELSI